MNGQDLLRGVDLLNREKNISRELIFTSIEKALRLAITKWQASMVSAAKPKKTRKKDKPEVVPVVDAAVVTPPEPDPDEIREEDIHVNIDRQTGDITARYKDEMLAPEVVGRIAAQSAKQLMIQNFREAESEQVFKIQRPKGRFGSGCGAETGKGRRECFSGKSRITPAPKRADSR